MRVTLLSSFPCGISRADVVVGAHLAAQLSLVASPTLDGRACPSVPFSYALSVLREDVYFVLIPHAPTLRAFVAFPPHPAAPLRFGAKASDGHFVDGRACPLLLRAEIAAQGCVF